MARPYVTPSGRRITFNAQVASARLADQGGFSMQRTTGKAPPRHGYMVSDHGSEEIIPGHASPSEIETYRRAHPNPRAYPKKFVGGWVDEGKTYLDQSRRVLTARSAQAAGRSNAQRAVFSLKHDTTRRVHFGGRTDVRGSLFEGHPDEARELRVGNSDALRQQKELELRLQQAGPNAGRAEAHLPSQGHQLRFAGMRDH